MVKVIESEFRLPGFEQQLLSHWLWTRSLTSFYLSMKWRDDSTYASSKNYMSCIRVYAAWVALHVTCSYVVLCKPLYWIFPIWPFWSTLHSSAALCPPGDWPRWTTWRLPCPLASSWVQSMRSADGKPEDGRKRSAYFSASSPSDCHVVSSAEGRSPCQQSSPTTTLPSF